MSTNPHTVAAHAVELEELRAPRCPRAPVARRLPSVRRARRRLALSAAYVGVDGGVLVTVLAATHSGAQLALGASALLLGALWVVFGACGLYRLTTITSARRQLEPLGAAAVVLALGLFMAERLSVAPSLPPTLSAALAGVVAPAILTGRLLLMPFVRRAARGAARRTLVVGDGTIAGYIGDELTTERVPEEGTLPVGGVARGTSSVAAAWDAAELDELVELCAATDVDRVVLLRHDLPRGELVRLAQDLVETGVEVSAVSEEFGVFETRVPAVRIDGKPVLRLRPTPLRGSRVLIKRIVDILGALLGLVALSPVLVTIAMLVKLTSAGPVLYKQSRIGRNGRPFTFLKFRSMIAGAPSSVHRNYAKAWISGEAAGTDDAGREVFKIVDDPRVTRVGRFLRRTSLDELPQLLNVLSGEMSLVGPRPCMPYESELFEEWQTRRLDVTPGCTGLWQVTARSSVGFQDMVLLDLYYISNWSLWNDLRLIALTVPVMVLGEGGH